MRNKKNVVVLQIIILAVICFIGCENENNNPNMDFIYPLAIGNSWQYDLIFTIDYDSTATSNGLADTTYSSTGLVEIITNEIIFDSLEVFNLATTITEEGNLYRGNEYYNNDDYSLVSYGYQSPSMITPRNNEDSAFICFDDKKFNNVREIFDYLERGVVEIDYLRGDSIYYDPVKCLEYPLTEDNQWEYRASNNPWRIEKTIIGQESIDVPAGQFNCWKIHWTFPESSWNDDIDFYDFISPEGLVKRVIECRNTEVIDEELSFVGYCNITEERYLTGYQIAD